MSLAVWLLAQHCCPWAPSGSMAIALVFCILAINITIYIVHDTWSCAVIYRCAQVDKTHDIHSACNIKLQKVKKKGLETIPHMYSFICTM